MTASSSGNTDPSPANSFEIKSAQLSTVALVLKSTDFAAVANDLQKQFGPKSDNPDFFDNDALVIDFSVVPRDAPYQDLKPLLQSIKRCRLLPAAARNAPPDWQKDLLSLQLAEASPEVVRAKPTPASPAQEPPPVQVQETRVEVIREVPGPATMVVDKPLRSGQKVYARGADLVVLAMVNQGAEVVADGNIHVYAPLRGKAMAGARGNTEARIFSLCLEPELVSIAGVYRTSENPLPQDVAGKAAQVRLSSDGQEKLIIEALKT